ncbi:MULTISPECIES: hypothetical protein [unclassified Variovorax]|uniref:hypothetical protein n=1 Tax=unclassified Variovorax TaxID=663243 RepID=UPI003F464F8D
MNAAQITPGSWKAVEWSRHSATTVKAGNLVVAECESPADARLIATAPDLLVIATRIEAALVRQGWLVDGSSPESEMLRDCRAAIASVAGSEA